MNIDLPYHRAWLEDEEINEVVDTLRSGWLTTGSKTQQFEESFKAYTGCKHAIALNSCTAGLHLSLAIMGFEEGCEVITSPMTFPATANAIFMERLRPVFVDIEPGTLNIDVSKLEEKITPKTRAIIPVHYAGHPCDMDAIETIASKHKLFILEDAAHALETKYKERKIGNMGHPASFSFYANKNITTGEGGMLATNDDKFAETVRVMRLQGISKDAWKRYGKSGYSHWEFHRPGYKYNMTDINAALGIHQLKKVDKFLAIRNRYANLYDEAFRDIPEIEPLEVKDYATSSHHIYPVTLQLERLTLNRDQVLDAIQTAGIGVAVHYVALHLQPYYRKQFKTKAQDFPVASHYSERILSLPLYPMMTSDNIERVIQVVTDIVQKHKK